ncbi:hypothetical protein EVAR_7595_1 [Eumeta japonica]|uniref:Uncharacterized protein n=1 Tax=Eumeta variegata TaxID=151549 RepID=A0A4C1S8P4_EUMVA|nr:hypothetical protein EVAR_7595_1 [Eumeta japonica]
MGQRPTLGIAARLPHRRTLILGKVAIQIRHTGTDGIGEYRRQYGLLESQRRTADADGNVKMRHTLMIFDALIGKGTVGRKKCYH